MNGWLLFMMIPLGAAAFGSLFDNDSDADYGDDHDGGDGAGGDPDLVANNLDGVLAGTEGDDTITATRDDIEATGSTVYDDNLGFVWSNYWDDPRWDWATELEYPEGEALPGLTVVEAGAGNDDITADLSTYVDAGAGNDTISVETPDLNEDPHYPQRDLHGLASAVHGGTGDDVITADGANIGIRADAGADTITTSGNLQFIDGGDGADLISVTHHDPRDPASDEIDPGATVMSVAGGACNDTIEASFDATRYRDIFGLEYNAFARGDDDDDTLIVSGTGADVRGGEGNDSLTISGEEMLVYGGTGADTINFAGLSDSTVHLTAEDVLQGYADSQDIDLRLSGIDQSQGTAGDDTIASETSGDIHLEGGAGDDHLSIQDRDAALADRASTLEGGQGDDTLIGGNYSRNISFGSHGEIPWGEGDSDDLLLGGDGDDTILFDQADTVTGGDGSMIYSADAGSSAVVTDFTAGEDVVTIYLNPEDVRLGADSLENPDEVSVSESAGKTLISLSGNQILSLDGTGLNIGFCHGSADDHGVWTDLNGNTVDPATLDVRIDAFETRNY